MGQSDADVVLVGDVARVPLFVGHAYTSRGYGRINRGPRELVIVRRTAPDFRGYADKRDVEVLEEEGGRFRGPHHFVVLSRRICYLGRGQLFALRRPIYHVLQPLRSFDQRDPFGPRCSGPRDEPGKSLFGVGCLDQVAEELERAGQRSGLVLCARHRRLDHAAVFVSCPRARRHLDVRGGLRLLQPLHELRLVRATTRESPGVITAQMPECSREGGQPFPGSHLVGDVHLQRSDNHAGLPVRQPGNRRDAPKHLRVEHPAVWPNLV